MESILSKYNFIPASIIKLSRTKRHKKFDDTKSSRSKYSHFNLDIAEFILKYFARDSKVILDPFAGWGERGYISKSLGYKYIGVDCSKEAIDYAKEKYGIINILGNSKDLPFKDNFFDFCYTCPPYWNLEKYESSPNQLTDIDDYYLFLKEYNKVISEIYRVLNNNSLCVFVVGDFRIKGKFYDFSTDTINLFIKFGFELFDKIIIDKTVNYRLPLFLPQADRLGYTIKVHEYILVFKKP